MSVEWFDQTPGSDMAQSQDDPFKWLLNGGRPDWIRVPANTGYGGQYRCLAVVPGVCPLPSHGELCRHFVLDGPVSCAECVLSGQFVWYRK